MWLGFGTGADDCQRRAGARRRPGLVRCHDCFLGRPPAHAAGSDSARPLQAIGKNAESQRELHGRREHFWGAPVGTVTKQLNRRIKEREFLGGRRCGGDREGSATEPRGWLPRLPLARTSYCQSAHRVVYAANVACQFAREARVPAHFHLIESKGHRMPGPDAEPSQQVPGLKWSRGVLSAKGASGQTARNIVEMISC